MVLITNGSGLDQPVVQEGLELFTNSDEIWVKLDGGTQEFLDKVNRPKISLDKTLENILTVARKRPVVIQSLFATCNGEEPTYSEIKQYAERLKELRRGGANIPVVQIYSATRPPAHSDCEHLPLKVLSFIAQTVRNIAGLKAEVF
jgi:wyosine [tRNA(Phe)-imidazoG37] synthetase (radical SAM superfamily)